MVVSSPVIQVVRILVYTLFLGNEDIVTCLNLFIFAFLFMLNIGFCRQHKHEILGIPYILLQYNVFIQYFITFCTIILYSFISDTNHKMHFVFLHRDLRELGLTASFAFLCVFVEALEMQILYILKYSKANISLGISLYLFSLF